MLRVKQSPIIKNPTVPHETSETDIENVVENSEPDDVPFEMTPEDPSEDDISSQIPEYLYIDPQVVGYTDITMQKNIYNFALTSTIPFIGECSILDIGCGRGDFISHITNLYPSLKTTYIGFEINDLIAKVGNTNLELFPEHTIINDDFISVEIADTFDHVYMIGALNMDYGLYETNNWDYIELMLRKAVDIAIKNITFVLFHDNGGDDKFVSYPIPNLTELVLKFNLPFVIDYDQDTGIYKLTISK